VTFQPSVSILRSCLYFERWLAVLPQLEIRRQCNVAVSRATFSLSVSSSIWKTANINYIVFDRSNSDFASNGQRYAIEDYTPSDSGMSINGALRIDPLSSAAARHITASSERWLPSCRHDDAFVCRGKLLDRQRGSHAADDAWCQ